MKHYIAKVRQATISFKSNYLIDIAHDIHHLDRVCNNALYINKIENNDDNTETIILSTYLHDFHRLCKKTETDNKLKKIEDSHQLIYDFFEKNPLYKNHYNKTISAISATDKYTFSNNQSGNQDINIVSKILSDADNLEALGAIGVARAFSFGQWINEPIYNPEIPLIDKEYSLTAKTHSVLHHFYEKLLKLENEFHTSTAKRLAKERIKFMENYISTFFKELNLSI